MTIGAISNPAVAGSYTNRSQVRSNPSEEALESVATKVKESQSGGDKDDAVPANGQRLNIVA